MKPIIAFFCLLAVAFNCGCGQYNTPLSGQQTNNVSGVVAPVSMPECQRLNAGWVQYLNNTKHPVKVIIDGVNYGIVPMESEKKFGPLSIGLHNDECMQTEGFILTRRTWKGKVDILVCQTTNISLDPL